jgi:spore germination protein GerM
MAFLHPVRHMPKRNTELLILVSVFLLLLFSLLALYLTHHLPQVRTVPQPVVASPATPATTTDKPLHFSKLQGNQSITEPVARAVPVTAGTSPLHDALTQLLQGPTAEEKANGYYSEIPAGTRLLDVQVKGNTVFVDLSREFTSGGGSTSMLQRVSELKSTIHSVAGNDRTIKIAIEGKPLHVLGGEGLELD